MAVDTVLWGVLGYVLLQLLLGVWVSRRIRNEEDYLLAGRRLGPGLAAFSVFATWFGAETVIGAGGRVYEHGLAGAALDPFGYALCLLLMGTFFAVRLWCMGLTTLADFFTCRFSAGTGRLAALLLVPGSVLWAAAQIRAFGQVLAVSSGELTVAVGISIAAVAVIAYTLTGGLLADAVTDVLQGVVLLLGLLVLAVAVWLAWPEGGVVPPPERLQLQQPDETGWQLLERWAIPIAGSLFSQELIARVLAARSAPVARGAALLGGAMYLAAGSIPLLLALAGPALLPGLEDAEQFIPQLARQHLHGALYVLFAGALVSAILSTVDSALLAAGALTSHNLVQPLFPGGSARFKLGTARAAVAVFGIVAWGLALASESIFGLVEAASSFGGAGVCVAMLAGLFSTRGGPVAAAAALLSGTGVWLLGGWLEWRTPFLAALAAAALLYTLAALAEGRGRCQRVS
jgi:Na+/proline symporter